MNEFVEAIAKELYIINGGISNWEGIASFRMGLYMDWAKRILSLRVGNKRLAVVEDGAKLPDNPHSMCYISVDKREAFAYSKAQQDMLKAGWVKEVKEDTLPTAGDIRGLVPDFTGDMKSGEYVKWLRE